jgi:hypothetical protein
MPYRKAWVWVLLLFTLTFVAFWPGYFSKLSAHSQAHHWHAAGAVLWTVLAIMQSWTVHNDRLALHRKTGLAVFALFPLFLLGGMWVIHVEAATLAGALGSPEAMADPDTSQIAQFGFFDPLANIGFAALFWGGLKYRHKVQLHARYMLATLLFVVAPIGFRLLSRYVPAFSSDTPETAWRFAFAMGGGNLIAFAIALYLYWLSPKHGRPFLLAAYVIAAQEMTYETLGRVPDWAPIFASFSALNLAFLLVVTAIASVGIAWHGWVAGTRPTNPAAALAH